ncbi:hypothetical protein [Cupriavidus sp.]|uniref:hypothetical protein n=1 Tax=Cupriavidus sp. TaxID=1873897 RepID=UPI0025C48C7B|nr:hypothetical protein [Cupriavidus sp.]MCA3774586.1 hypothetical protein [Cutibacterium sp.]MCA3183604.1 hypothetical protein [Cupriavidus sp.]MCA3193343.1 hypothetical protein [Cupriavidus sp.]MCA3198145.1 hypothetical protein [Cupriavidus sp.]MCA3204912.1 hypothetical protein [Cupriavidus sp.]
MGRILFLLAVTLIPASFIGLALYYIAVRPTKNDFFVGPVGLYTAVVLLLDLLIGIAGLVGFVHLLWVSPAERGKAWLIAGLFLVALVGTYGLAMQILRFVRPPIL